LRAAQTLLLHRYLAMGEMPAAVLLHAINSAIQQASDTARRAAEVTRQAAAGASFWVFASMLIGAIAAIFGARYGERDEQDLPAFVRLRSSERPSR